jgi:ankyrin repeat protein
MRKILTIMFAVGALAGCAGFSLTEASAYAQTTDFFTLVKAGKPQQIQAAIDQGANVNAQDRDGTTPLMYAAIYNQNPEVITTLVKAGADIRARTKDGVTPLMCAAKYNPSPKVIITLLKAGADPKARDKAGETVFDYAQENEKLKGTDAYEQLQEAAQ